MCLLVLTPSSCKDNANRPNYLLIVKSDGLSCTTGVPPLNKMHDDPENRGPLMRLTADLDIGKRNLVANYAHQMGVSIPCYFANL
jgi:hypothetical protein